MKPDKELEKQLKNATALHDEYTKAKDKLREIFYNVYDQATIVSLLDVIQKYRHPIEKDFAEKFASDYKNGNFDEVEIDMLRNLMRRYQEQVIKKLNEEE